jgi:hypothetical protein
MTERPHRNDEPLSSEDLLKCQLIMEGYCRRNSVPLRSSEATRVGAIIIELYRQGVRDMRQLRFLVEGKQTQGVQDSTAST